MSGDLVELPVEVEVTPERYGTIRSVNVVTGNDIPPELDTQDWRLEEISVENYVREEENIDGIDKTTKVGVVQVCLKNLKWEYVQE
ncbi:hypothetical protein ACOJIV_20405 [Haloarcula sp. AONF1]